MHISTSAPLRTPLHLVVFLALTATLASVISAQSGAYEQLLAQANAELQAGQIDQALADSKKAVALDSARWEAHRVAGIAFETQKHYDDAVSEFAQALEHAPAESKSDTANNLEAALDGSASDFVHHASETWQSVTGDEFDKSLLPTLEALKSGAPIATLTVERLQQYADHQKSALSALAGNADHDWVLLSGFNEADRANTEGPAKSYLDGWSQRLTTLQQLIQQFIPVLTSARQALQAAASGATITTTPQTTSKVNPTALDQLIASLNNCDHSIATIAGELREAHYVVF